MTEPKNFLERWSRKKAEAQREAAETPATPATPDVPGGAPDTAKTDTVGAPASRAEAMPSPPPAPKPEFDLASLPSLESITVATDIRPFLSPGVPQELTRAALRRAWLADPAIRDFVGLAENDWDFTNPAAVPGFGDIPPGYDIKNMVARIFGEKNSEAIKRTDNASLEAPSTPAEPEGTPIADESASEQTTAVVSAAPETGEPVQPLRLSGAAAALPENAPIDGVQRNNNTASQQNIAEVTPRDSRRRRQHGGALPEL